MELNEEIKRIATELNCLYFRATPEEMNVLVEDRDLQGLTLVNFANFPTVEYSLETYLRGDYPLEIEVIRLAEQDDSTEDSDVHVNYCRKIAERLAMKLLDVPEVLGFPDSFTTDTFGQVKKYDDVLTGVTLNITVTVNASC